MGMNTDDPVYAAARAAAGEERSLSIKSYTLPQDIEAQLQQILLIFLREAGQESAANSLEYCVRELTTNAKKANTKRAFFLENQIDIHDASAYRAGMQRFKRETLENIHYWLQQQEKAGLYIRVTFCIAGGEFLLEVANNTRMTETEHRRVYDRIIRSRGFHTMAEAMAEVLDDSEGAGLGIAILVLMLKKLGLPETAFDITVEDGETVARIRIPMHPKRIQELHHLYRKTLTHFPGVPQRPDQIQQLRQALANPLTNDAQLVTQITRDPCLTAEILRRAHRDVNVPPGDRITVDSALSTLQAAGLRRMIAECETIPLAEDEEIWKVSQRVGWYSYALARTLLSDPDQLEIAYMGGLLHALGTLLIPAVAHYPEAGAYFADQWQFGPHLVMCIRYHRNPHGAPEEFSTLASVVHLAYILANPENAPPLVPDALRRIGVPRERLPDLQHQLSTQFRHDFLDHQ